MTSKEKEAHRKAIETKQTAARAVFSARDRAIFEFLKSRWSALGDAYDADKHDAPLLDEAAQKFEVPSAVAKEIYEKVDGAGLDV